jgi:hypothetical protein
VRTGGGSPPSSARREQPQSPPAARTEHPRAGPARPTTGALFRRLRVSAGARSASDASGRCLRPRRPWADQNRPDSQRAACGHRRRRLRLGIEPPASDPRKARAGRAAGRERSASPVGRARARASNDRRREGARPGKAGSSVIETRKRGDNPPAETGALRLWSGAGQRIGVPRCCAPSVSPSVSPSSGLLRLTADTVWRAPHSVDTV